MKMFVLMWLACFGSASHAATVGQVLTYRKLQGHQIVRISGDSLDTFLSEALKAIPSLDILHRHSVGETRARVAPTDKEAFHSLLAHSDLEHDVEVEDLSEYLRAHDLKQQRAASARLEETCDESGCPAPLKSSYMTFEQMERYMMDLASNNPARVQLTSIGKSFEGRDIWMVHVSPDGSRISDSDSASPGSVWIEGGLHAREWISPSSTLHLLHERVTACDSQCDLDYYFVPIANPDGYEYSRTTDRMWRKNRAVTTRSDCGGVDLNRNWDYKFGVGASSDPCSETYMGPAAFSEPETRALSNAMSKVDNLKLMITFHSFGQAVLYPWGWTDEPIEDKEQLVRAGNAFADAAMRTTGKSYAVENSAGGLYFASGATDDWAKKVLNAPYSFTIELRDSGMNGFILDASEIEPTAREVVAGVSALISEIRK